MSDQLETKGWT